MTRIPTFFAALAALAALAAPAAMAVSYVDEPGPDVTVLQAWIGASVGVGAYVSYKKLDVAACTPLEQRSSPGSATSHASTYVVADCAAPAEQLMRLDAAAPVSPLVTAFNYAYARDDVTGTIYSASGACELIELRTVTRDAALAAPTFTGIGFFYQSGDFHDGPAEGRFVAKARLHAVGHVTLEGGQPATVHRFLAHGMCMGQGGNGDSIYHRSFNFRPYAQFQDGDTIFNVWDQVPADYRLGLAKYPQTGWTTTFDRQTELLAH